MSKLKKDFGVYIGRLSPMHLGHERIIRQMINDYGNNCLLILGSSSEKQSMRHFFPYDIRVSFVKTVFPKLRVVGMPDYEFDNDWMTALEDIVYAVAQVGLRDIELYGGCDQDTAWFKQRGYSTTIVDRTTGTTAFISATEIRQRLLNKLELRGLVNPFFELTYHNTFANLWKEFVKI